MWVSSWEPRSLFNEACSTGLCHIPALHMPRRELAALSGNRPDIENRQAASKIRRVVFGYPWVHGSYEYALLRSRREVIGWLEVWHACGLYACGRDEQFLCRRHPRSPIPEHRAGAIAGSAI